MASYKYMYIFCSVSIKFNLLTLQNRRKWPCHRNSTTPQTKQKNWGKIINFFISFLCTQMKSCDSKVLAEDNEIPLHSTLSLVEKLNVMLTEMYIMSCTAPKNSIKK